MEKRIPASSKCYSYKPWQRFKQLYMRMENLPSDWLEHFAINLSLIYNPNIRNEFFKPDQEFPNVRFTIKYIKRRHFYRRLKEQFSLECSRNNWPSPTSTSELFHIGFTSECLLVVINVLQFFYSRTIDSDIRIWLIAIDNWRLGAVMCSPTRMPKLLSRAYEKRRCYTNYDEQ